MIFCLLKKERENRYTGYILQCNLVKRDKVFVDFVSFFMEQTVKN